MMKGMIARFEGQLMTGRGRHELGMRRGPRSRAQPSTNDQRHRRISGLQEAGIDFVCADMPSANRLTVGIMAMVAEEEARQISKRTKDALLAVKIRISHQKFFRPMRRTRLRRRGRAPLITRKIASTWWGDKPLWEGHFPRFDLIASPGREQALWPRTLLL
jgi:hypothetical protein